MVVGPDVILAQGMATAGTLDVTMDSLTNGGHRWHGDEHRWHCTTWAVEALLRAASWHQVTRVGIAGRAQHLARGRPRSAVAVRSERQAMNPDFLNIDFGAFTWADNEDPPAGAGKPCIRVPCPSFVEGSIVHDDTFVPTLEDCRQAGGPWAGPEGRFYVERDGRVVLLRAEDV